MTTTVVSDSFTRSNSTSLGTADTGQTWATLGTGVWGTNGSAALLESNASSTIDIAYIDSGVSDCTVSVTAATTWSGGAQTGLAFRVADASSNYYLLWLDSSGHYYCSKGTSHTTMFTTTVSGKSGDVVSVTLSGTSVTASVNGTQIGSFTDNTLTANTKHGLGSHQYSAQFDNFSVTTNAAPTPSGTITATGTSTAIVTGSAVTNPTGTITASGSASASISGFPVPTGSISASGTSNVIVRGPKTTYFLSPNFPAMFTAQAQVTPTGAISAAGTSSVSITGSAVSGDSISAQGTSTVTVNGYSVPIGLVSTQGTSSASVSGHTIVMGSISAQGTSSASVSGTAVSNASITAQGSSSVSVSGVPIVTASITAQGVSSVTIESSGAVFGSITAGGTSVIDIEGHTVIVGQINAQGTATVVVSTAKPIRASIQLQASLDNRISLLASLDNEISLLAGVAPVAQTGQNFAIEQYSSDAFTFTYSGDLSGCTLEWIMQYNVNSATPLIKKTSADGINITSTSSTSSVFVVSVLNADMASIGQGVYYHQASLVDATGQSNPISKGSVTVLAASNN